MRKQQWQLPATTVAVQSEGCRRASGRLRAFHCELPLPLPGPTSPLPQEHCFVPSSTYSVVWAGLCPHPRGTGLITPPIHIPGSVVRDLLAPCSPKAGQTYLSQPQGFWHICSCKVDEVYFYGKVRTVLINTLYQPFAYLACCISWWYGSFLALWKWFH